MVKRFQTSTVSKVHASWIGRWRQNGERRVQQLGRVRRMNQSEAKEKLAEILRPINASAEGNPNRTFDDFVENVYFPFCRRKWKRSTKMTTQDRIQFHLIGEFKNRRVSELTRDKLQAFLDKKAATLSFSTV